MCDLGEHTDVGSTKVWGGGPISHFSKHSCFVNYAASCFILFLLPAAVEHQSSISRVFSGGLESQMCSPKGHFKARTDAKGEAR